MSCAACGIIFLDPQPTSNDLEKMYSRGYFEGDYRCGHAGSYFDESARGKLGSEPLLRKIWNMKRTGDKFLEIGCAGGATLAAARSIGFRVQGIEYSAEAAELARKSYDLDVLQGDIFSAGIQDESFDVVYLGDVLEHLLDPVASLKKIYGILRPHGMVVVLCPAQTNTMYSRIGFFLYHRAGKRATVQLPPYHVFEYRPASITYLVQRTGFKILELKNSALPPSELVLRGPRIQRMMKKSFQYPNYIITKLSNRLGDRIELYGIKEKEKMH